MTDSPYTLAERIDSKRMHELDKALLDTITQFTKERGLAPDEGIEVVARWLGCAQLVGAASDVAAATQATGIDGDALATHMRDASTTMVVMAHGARVAWAPIYAKAIGMAWPPATEEASAPTGETTQ